MKKYLAAALLAAGLATPAMSADMPLKAAPINPAYDWSGFYFGFAVGGVWGDFTRNYFEPNQGNYSQTTSYSRLHYAGFGGVQKQFGDWVFGVEGAWNSPVRDISAIAGAPLAAANSGYDSRVMDIATFGGRAGYAGWNNWLVYATGGWATARLDALYTLNGLPAFGQNSGTSKVNGWYAGAGVEYMLYKGVIADTIIGAEYQHMDFDRGLHFETAGNANNFRFSTSLDIVRARLSFKFNPWRPAAVVAKY